MAIGFAIVPNIVITQRGKHTMAKTVNGNKSINHRPKKTRQGNSKFTKHSNKGGGANGTRPSKTYKKKVPWTREIE